MFEVRANLFVSDLDDKFTVILASWPTLEEAQADEWDAWGFPISTWIVEVN